MRILPSTAIENMEIVNLCGGARLGCASSFELQTDGCGTLTVTALLVPCGSPLSGLLPFGRREYLRIPLSRVECIGEDTILVRLTDAELAGCRVKEK